jgi:hypothetical protein
VRVRKEMLEEGARANQRIQNMMASKEMCQGQIRYFTLLKSFFLTIQENIHEDTNQKFTFNVFLKYFRYKRLR